MADDRSHEHFSEQQKLDLYREYSKACLKTTDYEAWLEKKSIELKVSEGVLRRIISRQDEQVLFEAQKARASIAQKIARLQGAVLARAYAVLEEALGASVKKSVHDRDGNLTAEYEYPNWDAKLAAVEKIIKTFGGYAPEKVEHLPPGGEFDGLSDADIEQRLESLRNARGAQAGAGASRKTGDK